jgi:sodium/proline symporter
MDLVGILFHPLIAGLCLAAILAAVMSTADSQLLVSSAAFTEDFYRRLIRPAAGPGELVLAGRASVLVLAGLAFLLALDPDAMVLDLVSYAWAGFGAAFGPVLILSVYWRRMTRGGALAGVLAGGLTVVAWKQLSGGIFDLYELVPGFVLAWLAAWLVSRAGRAPGGNVTAAYDRALARLGEAGADRGR